MADPSMLQASAVQKQRRPWFVLVLCCTAFVALAYFVLQQRLLSGRGMPEFSVYSEGHSGLAKAAWLLEQLGWQTEALTRPVQQTRCRGLLILVEPQEQTSMLGFPYYLSETEAKGLLGWVAEGNTLLLCSRHTTRIHSDLGVTVAGKTQKKNPPLLRADPEFSGFTQQIDDLEVEGRLTLSSRRGLALWWLGDDPGALLLGYKKGRVILVTDPTLLTHRGLVRQDNVMFLCNLARLCSEDGVVYFDEFHHGLRTSSGYWAYLRFHDHHWVVLQLLAIFGVGVWGLAVRLGPARATPQISRADGVDYASAVARIYQQAGVRHRLARWLVTDFINRLTKQLRLRRNAPLNHVLAAWKKHTPIGNGPELAPLLNGVNELRQRADSTEPIAVRELLHWARAFDDFLRAYATPGR